MALNGKTAGEPKDQRRQDTPGIPIRHRYRESLPPRRGLVGIISVANIDLARREEPQKGPAHEEPDPAPEARGDGFGVWHEIVLRVHLDELNKPWRQKQKCSAQIETKAFPAN